MKIVLFFTYGIFLFLFTVPSEGAAECLDINGRTIGESSHYVPGPDACTLCICDKGLPNLCKAVLCKPPECQSFIRVGPSCCNFTCLDDARHKQEDLRSDIGLRLVVSGVAALLSLSLLIFLVHRLRQRKAVGRQTRSLRAERRGLSGLNYMAGDLGYLPENYYPGADGFDRHIEFHYEEAPSHMSLWKPPGSYLPRGEAPPPYEEAIAHSRPELIITASSTLPNISHRTIPLNLTAPGTIRIIHPQQRHSYQEPGCGVVTLPRTLVKPHDAANSTLHINISGCSFRAVQSSDEAAQVPTPPELINPISADAPCDNAEPLVTTDTPIPETPSIQLQVNSLNNPATKCETHETCRSRTEGDDCDEADDADDFRSECENCKSSPGGGGAYYTEEESDTPETMTLQRVPREADDDAYYRSSVTLPAQCKQPRRVLGSREGWFSSMPESSSEED